MEVERQVPLRFTTGGPSALSAACRNGPWLWVPGDEAPRIERLRVDGPDETAYTGHESFPLGAFVDLPDGPDEEVDVEGLDLSGGSLWVVGSHSRTRKSVGPRDDEGEALDELATVRSHPNRHVLVRLPLGEDDGTPVPVRSGTSPDGRLVTAALLDGGVGGLADALSTDRHLAPFLPVPGKDNGLDVEGLVALPEGVLVGLRGPVLRGWAVVLELHLHEVPGRSARLALSRDGRGYRSFFLDLGGLGIRDLARAGDDVLVLAGPTMDLDGPVRLHRWLSAAAERKTRLVRADEVVRLDGDLPVGSGEDEGKDHPEGVTPLPDGERVLVVHDSPTEARAPDGGPVLADIIRLP